MKARSILDTIGRTPHVRINRLFGDAQVWVLRLRDGAADYRLSSTANPHGRWIDWVPESPWKRWEPKY